MDAVTLAMAQSYAVRGKQWATLPKGWDAAWKAAKAAQATTPAWMAFLGDSITAGQGSSDWLTNSWTSKLRSKLITAGNTLWGDFYPATVYGSSFGSMVGTSPYTSFMNGTPVSLESGYGRALLGTTSSSTTFVTPYATTAFDIVFIDYGSGTWTYTVDGGAAQTVTCSNATNVQNATVRKVSVTGLTSATHTIVIGGASASSVLILVGISCFTGSAGIGFVRSGFSGIRAIDLTMTRGTGTGADGSISMPPDKIALWQGQNPGGAAPTTPTGFGFPTQPALAILAYGVNDMNLGAPVNIFRTAHHRLISAFRRGYPDCSIVILANSDPAGSIFSDDAAPGGRSYDWGRYKAVMREIAGSYGCAYVDIDAKWNALAYTRGFLTSSDVHPTDAGHNDIATVLASIL